MASIQVLNRNSGKRYRVQFMKNGKRIGKVFTRKKDAEFYLSSLTVNSQFADSLTEHNATSFLLADAIQEFIVQYTNKCKSTIQRLKFWSDQYGYLVVGKFTRKEVKQGLVKLSDKGMAPSTLNRYKAAISALYTYLQAEYDYGQNPARQVRQFNENNARCRFLSDEERKRLLIVVKKSNWKRLNLLVLMALTTGARRGDLIGLKWADINFIVKTATVHVTKNGEPRVLPLTSEVIDELNKHKGMAEGYVFPNPSNEYQCFRNFDCYWKKALEDSVVLNFKFHDLRHTAASYLAMANVQIGQIADILGHKTLDVTKRYIHLSTSYKANVINDVMGGIR